MMLQQDKPEDYVIATGKQYSVRHFIQKAAERIGFSIVFEGEGVEEIGIVEEVFNEEIHLKKGDVIVKIDPRYYRPAEVETLLGNPSKAKEKLFWIPRYTLEMLIDEMIEVDYALSKRDFILKEQGLQTALSKETE